MADHPFRFGPFLLRLMHPEEVDEPVRVRLEILRIHAGEPPEIAFQPRAKAVDHGHALQVDGITHVGLVGLARALRRFDQRVVGLLHVVDYYRALGDVAEQRVLDALG